MSRAKPRVVSVGGRKGGVGKSLGLDADAVIIDVGAGTSFNTLDLFDLADVKLAVVTPCKTPE